jgi:hypothetical protein
VLGACRGGTWDDHPGKQLVRGGGGVGHHRTRPVIARDPLRLAAARLAADYVLRAEAWAGDVDEELVVALEQLHQRILDHIGNIPTYVDGADEVA